MQLHEKDQSAALNVDRLWRIGIVVSPYYKELTDTLVAAAKAELTTTGILPENIMLYEAPGSFEIPLVGAEVAASKSVDALIGFGIIIQGETAHADHIAAEASRGIMDVQLQYRIPFGHGILHVPSMEHAKARATGDGNRGTEVARAVIHSLAELSRIRS